MLNLRWIRRFRERMRGEINIEPVKINEMYAAVALIEILMKKGLVNPETYANVVRNTSKAPAKGHSI